MSSLIPVLRSLNGTPLKKFHFMLQVDESIMGGLTLQIGDKFLDLSVKSKIDTIMGTLKSA